MANFRDNKKLGLKNLGTKAKTKTAGSMYYGAAYNLADNALFNKYMGNVHNTINKAQWLDVKNKLYNKSKQQNDVAKTNAYSNYVGSAGSAYNYANGNPSAVNASSAQSMTDPNMFAEFWKAMSDSNNQLNIQMNRENNKFNADQAALQRNWEANMANTAHQREVSDLQAAGLNPILSAGGTGAVSPSGSSASASNWSGADSSYINALAQIAATSLSSNAAITAASLNSSAVMQSAAMSAQANMYSADQSKAASMYGSDKSYLSSVYTSDNAYKASKYGTDKGYTANLINSAVHGLSGLANILAFL